MRRDFVGAVMAVPSKMDAAQAHCLAAFGTDAFSASADPRTLDFS